MLNKLELCRFKRTAKSDWEIGINIEISGGNDYIFDISMEKPESIWDVMSLHELEINLMPIIRNAQKSIEALNEWRKE